MASPLASPSQDTDIEAQLNSASESRPPVIINSPPHLPDTPLPELPSSADPQPQARDAHQHHIGNPLVQEYVGDSQALRDEKHADSSDGLWSIYLTEAEKRDTEVIEKWKSDTNGILVFTGLFSATVASFIIESYRNLSPNSSNTTNALLVQISQQLVNISNGTPLTNVLSQSNPPFKPSASAIRVNVLWFLSLILSLNCALSATLMQQWARRYQELGQRRGTFHKRGRMRAYIFHGIHRFKMARAVAAMPTLLHISVFLFFAGLVEFLFPIQATVAYVTLGCIGMFALAYAILTVLPNIYPSCPYATPLSGSTWRLSQLSVIGSLWTILKFEGRCRKSLPMIWSLANQDASDRLRRWRKALEKKVNIRRQWLSQGMRKIIELSAYKADSTVVTSALVWTLTALDEDQEIEDFAARVPGFFDSRVVPDATLALLPLMSHQQHTDPIFGPRLYDLLKTCMPETSILDEEKRKKRLRICMNCLWYFGKAYNELGSSQTLPYYFPDTLASPRITRCIQAEDDSGVRVIGRCFGALIVNKLAADLELRTDPIREEELACLSTIVGTETHDLSLLLLQPGAVALLNMISLTFDEIGGLVTCKVPLGVLPVVQQTLSILSRTRSSVKTAEVQLDRPISIIDGSDGTFEHILISSILDLLIQVASHHTAGVRTSCLRLCLRGLWYFGREFNRLKIPVPLPSYLCIAFANPEVANSIGQSNDPVAHEIGRCVGALIVNKLAADINSSVDPIRDAELRCLSAILGSKACDVMRLLRHQGAIEFTNIVFLALTDIDSAFASMPSDVPDVVQQTFAILCQALPTELNAAMQLYQRDILMNGASSLTTEMYLSVLRVWMKNLWHFTREYNERGGSMPLPSYICIAFTNPELTRRIRKQHDLAVRVIGRCVEALIINKLAADLNSRNLPVNHEELACLSVILGTKSDDVMLLLSHPGAIEFTNMVFLALDDFYSLTLGTVPSYVLDVIQQTSSALYQDLQHDLKAKMRLNQTSTLMNVSAGTSSLTADMYLCILRVWMKNLWHFTRGYSERGNSVPLPPFVCVAFANPEMTCRICKQRDLAVRVIGRCVEALVINKLAADIHSRSTPVSNDELACLSAILGTESRDMMLLLKHPGAIEITNMVFLALDDSDSFAQGTVPSYVMDVIQQTSSALSRVLPPELNAKMRINQTNTLINLSDGTSRLTAERYMNILNVWVKNLWHFTREYNEHENTVPLPPYVCVAFTNPEMSHRIRKQRDLSVRAIGRCIEVLVVNKLAADIHSRDVPVRNYELACLSTILNTESDDVILLLSCPGAIELTNLVFFALDDFDTFTLRTVPSYTLDVVQQTSIALYSALPSEMNIRMRLSQENTLNNSDGSLPLTAEIYRTILRAWAQNLWYIMREYNEQDNSVPLPSYVCAAFTNPEMSRRIRKQRDLAIHVLGRCVEALVVNKITANILSRYNSVSNDDLACLSSILGTKSDDVVLLLSCPGAIDLTNVVFLASDNFYHFTNETVPSYVLGVLQQTTSALSWALPPELVATMRLTQTSPLMNLSDGTSTFMAEIYKTVLLVWMKNLWCFTRGYNDARNFVPLPSYVCGAFANPAMSRHIHEERDLAVHAIGRCVKALVVNNIANIKSRNALVSDDQLACLSTILGTERDDVAFLLRHPGAIEFTNMLFLALGDVSSSASASVSLDVPDLVQKTFDILSWALPAKLNARMRFDRTQDRTNTVTNLSVVASPLAAETVLYAWMKNLWRFMKEVNEPGNSEPLPSYICSAFTNPEMTRRILGKSASGLAVHVIGRCVEALIVNKLAADINARDAPASNVELACLSAILGSTSDNVVLLLRHQGAIELSNMLFLSWANIDSESASVPSDVLDVLNQTFAILSPALPTELNAMMPVDQTYNLLNTPDGTSSLTAEMYRAALRVWTKNLWHFTRGHSEPGSSAPLPSYVYIAFTNPEMSRRIQEQRDLTVHAVGRCVGALVVNKLSADIKLRNCPVSNDELACLSTILGTEKHNVMLLLSCPGAIELTNMVFLALDDSYSFTIGKVPSYMPEVIQQTSDALCWALPPELRTKMRFDQINPMMNISDVASCLTTDVYRAALRASMQKIWYFMRWYNERGNSVPLPSYIRVAFTNPEMARRIHEQEDLALREIGRCVGALVVNKLTADVNSLKVLVSNGEIACLSSILGTSSDDVRLLLSHPGAVEFTNVVFLALDDFDNCSPRTVPTYLLDVVQQTFSTLSYDLPLELKAMMRLTQTDTLMNGSDRTSTVKAEIYTALLHELMKSIWHFTSDCNECGSMVPLPSSVYVAFTNPDMIRHIRKRQDLAFRTIGHCVGALVVNKLAADINSRNVPANDEELACLSAILGIQSLDLRFCLSRPGTIELLNLAFLASGDVSSSFHADKMLPDTHSVFQETLAIVSQALPVRVTARLPLTLVALANVSDDNFERTIVSRFHGLLKMCVPGASSLVEEDRTSRLRTSLRSLWHWGQAYLQTSAPLPSYFPLLLASPEITRHFQTERDPVARITGYCFGALVVSKLVDALELPVSPGVDVRNAYLACISAILGTEHCEVFLLHHRLRIINLRNVVSIISGEVHTLSAGAGMPADVLTISQDTLNILANRLRGRLFVSGVLPIDQWRSMQEEYSGVVSALSSNQFKNETVKTLDRLQQILEKLRPGVECSQDEDPA